MEERFIIRKSTSEYESQLVLVWKKNGDLRICMNFRWLNKTNLKDAHPLPYQVDCFAALGGNCLFSTIDLTSLFYNMLLHEDDKKYSGFITSMSLYKYNMLPQGLCNSQASLMCTMTIYVIWVIWVIQFSTVTVTQTDQQPCVSQAKDACSDFVHALFSGFVTCDSTDADHVQTRCSSRQVWC